MNQQAKRGALALLTGALLACLALPALALPAGAVMSFNLAACPDGWTAYTAGAGRSILGVGTLGSDTYALGATGGSARHTLTTAEMPSHTHGAPGGNGFVVTGGGSNWQFVNWSGGTWVQLSTLTAGTGGGGAHENRHPYVALRLCQLTADEETEEDNGPQAVVLAAAIAAFALGFLTSRNYV